MKFAATIIYVPDVRAALAFYASAFGLATAFISDEGDYGDLETGAVRLGFDSEALADQAGFPGGYRPNPHLLVTPEEKPWGRTIAYVRDPWGTLIALGTPWSAPAA